MHTELEFFDTHSHISNPRFADDVAAVVERALAARVTRIVCVGIDFETSRTAIALSERFPAVFATVGWHPSDVLDAPEDVRPVLRDLARHPKVVAIGETGLDYYHPPAAGPDGTPLDPAEFRRRQTILFQQQLEVAADCGLNVVIHHRKSLDDCLAVLQPFADRVRGQFHCFEDNAEALQRVINVGSLVSFTGLLTFRNRQDVRDALAAAPAGSFMFETDCPYLVPEPHRGRFKRCEPAFIRDTAEVGARARNCSVEQLSAETVATARKFFPRMT